MPVRRRSPSLLPAVVAAAWLWDASASRTDNVCPQLSVAEVGGSSSSGACAGAVGTYSRLGTNFNGRPFYSSSGTPVFYIYHSNRSSNAWDLSPIIQPGLPEPCEFSSGATSRDDPTMGPQLWTNPSGNALAITCSSADAKCYGNRSRPTGCSCEYSENGGSVEVSDASLCTSGCCRSGRCQETQAWCLRFWIIGAVAALLIVLVVLFLVWKPHQGLLNHKARVTPAVTVRSVEMQQRSKWDLEVAEAARRGYVMTWWAYGEDVKVPPMEIYEIKAARIGVEYPSVIDPVKVLISMRQRVEMGGVSFRYDASVVGDKLELSKGHPLVIKYVPYTKDVELPKLKKTSSTSVVSPEVQIELQKRSRNSVPEVAAMIRRSSNGGFVNGWPVIRPETGAAFEDPFVGPGVDAFHGLGGAIQPLDIDASVASSKPSPDNTYRGRESGLQQDRGLSDTGKSVAEALASLRAMGLKDSPPSALPKTAPLSSTKLIALSPVVVSPSAPSAPATLSPVQD